MDCEIVAYKLFICGEEFINKASFSPLIGGSYEATETPRGRTTKINQHCFLFSFRHYFFLSDSS